MIIPTHDRPELLIRALSSVLDQTHQRLEIIVVDDASKENAGPLVESLHDDRIIFLRHERAQGPSASRNDGIAIANGEYIAFLDDDDEWLPRRISDQLEDLEKKGWQYKVGYCQGEIYDESKGTRSVYEWHGHDGEHLDQLIAGQIRPPTISFMIARECLQKVGGFRSDLGSMEDRELWIRLAELYEFAFLDRVLFRAHVKHGSRVSQDYRARLDAQATIFRAHRGLLWGHRKAWSEFLRNYGFELLGHGRKRESTFQFMRSIALDPLRSEPYVALYLSLRRKVSPPR